MKFTPSLDVERETRPRNLSSWIASAPSAEPSSRDAPHELIDHESVDAVTGVVRQQVMLTIMELSKVKPPLWGMEQSSLLAPCFSSIFSLPPAQTIQGVEAALNTKTLKALDEMRKALVCKDQKPNLVVLQNILEFLLPRTTSKEVHGQLRAVVRISWLIILIAGHHKFKVSSL
ncbi:unnamed protein product [Caretta caretta]